MVRRKAQTISLVTPESRKTAPPLSNGRQERLEISGSGMPDAREPER